MISLGQGLACGLKNIFLVTGGNFTSRQSHVMVLGFIQFSSNLLSCVISNSSHFLLLGTYPQFYPFLFCQGLLLLYSLMFSKLTVMQSHSTQLQQAAHPLFLHSSKSLSYFSSSFQLLPGFSPPTEMSILYKTLVIIDSK